MESLLTTILLAVDGSPAADEAGWAAIALAQMTGAILHVVHAWHVPPEHADPALGPEDRAAITAMHEELGRNELAGAVERLIEAGGTVADAQLRHGYPAAEVLAEAATVGADLIVTGNCGADQTRRAPLGSVAEAIVRSASCPVLVVRGNGNAWPPARIVVGDNGSAGSDRAVTLAASIAGGAHADLVLVRAVSASPVSCDPADEEGTQSVQFQTAALRRAAADLALRAGTLAPRLGRLPAVRATVEDAAIALLDIADEAPKPVLITVGTRGTAPARQLWPGSTALRVLTWANGSVLVCPRRAVSDEED
jgi:nucleotide-binding universal stress UspA family protein